MLDADAQRDPLPRIRPKAGHRPDPLQREPARRRVTVMTRLAVLIEESLRLVERITILLRAERRAGDEKCQSEQTS